MLDRLRQDAGTRTYGELVQEREWAYREILTLRERVARYAVPVQSTRGPRAAGGHREDTTVTVRRPSGLRYLRLREVCDRVALKPSGIYRLIAIGHFPKQLKLSERTVVWIESEIEAFMDARIVARDSQATAAEPVLSPYMRMGEVLKRTGLKSSELYDGIREGSFPKWAPLPKIASGWVREDVEAWIEVRNQQESTADKK